MAETILEIQHLKKYFNTKRGLLHAVDDVSFSIEKGHTLGVVGESGCGKSTLGRVILHLLESTDGKIIFKGRDVTKVTRAELSQLRHERKGDRKENHGNDGHGGPGTAVLQCLSP